jgi:DNA-binding PadR family transcriptional regulator
MRSPSALGYAILGLVGQELLSGYDLRKIFSHTPFDHFSDSPGAIYPALRRLEREGWLKASAPLGGRRRTTYGLTPAGRRRFVAWLEQRPTRDEVVGNMDSLMLRFAFLGEARPVAYAVRFLEALSREVRSHLEDLRRFRQSPGVGPSVTGALAFDAGVASYQAYAAWARRARAALVKGGGRR